ncbi:uncharacterized protein PG998_014693 [Apiospora kogelbergensis]|uniref:uncharacterized protein n=1 Tax=Apiospora kogelbergensis TaxID=1337665 RepID=UPI00312CEA8F
MVRCPAHLPSDVQKATAVFKKELRHLRDVVVFPTTGSEPLANILSGSDYDGDEAWKSYLGICTNFKETFCAKGNCISDKAAHSLSWLLSDEGKQGLEFTDKIWSLYVKEIKGKHYSPVFETSSNLVSQGNSTYIIDYLKAASKTEVHNGLQAIYNSMARGHHQAAKRLLSLGASPAQSQEAVDQRTALHLAAALPYPDIIERIVQMGAAINSRDENGDTALVYAVASRTSTREIIALLAKLGADVNHMTSFRGLDTRLLGLACALEHWELADELLDCEGDANGGTHDPGSSVTPRARD